MLSTPPILFLFLLFSKVVSGLSIRGGSIREVDDLSFLQEAGATHVRLYLLWKDIEPVLPSSFNRSLNVADLRSDPSLTETWAQSRDWGYFDSLVSTSEAKGLEPIIEVGEGTFYGLPRLGNSSGPVADPVVLGRQCYLAHVYRAARAVAARYGKPGWIFQIENELNEAWLAAIGGQRPFREIWRDFGFLDELLTTLRFAVKDANADILVTTNLHTDIPQVVHDLLFLPGFYLEATARWHSLIDVWSFDAYPNMYDAVPDRSREVVERGLAIAKIAGAKPFVMETGVPVAARSVSLSTPVIGNFTEANQAQYVSAACSDSLELLDGFMLFTMAESPGLMPPPGGYTPIDLRGLAAIESLFTGQHVLASIAFLASEDGRLFIEKRLSKDLSVSQAWGPIDSDGRKRPAFDALRNCFAKN